MTTTLSRRELLERAAAGGSVILLPGIFAACGGDGDEGGRAEGTKDSLVILGGDVPPGLNLDGAQVANSATNSAIGNLYDTLIAIGRTQAGDVLEPDFETFDGVLAEEWEQNGLEWTFRLRRGVKSCAGNELTADDVVYTFERAKSVTGPVPCGWFLANVGSVLGPEVFAEDATPETKRLSGEVVKIDDYTVKINQFEPNELFPDVLTIFCLGIFDSAELKKHATEEDPWAHQWTDTVGAAGFGPYCVKSWEKGVSFTLEANPNYFRGEPQFKTITIRKVPQSSNRVAALLRGEADIVTELTPREFDEIRNSEGVKLLSWTPGSLGFGVSLNYQTEPWSAEGNAEKQRLLRQAIAYAIPYDAIIEKAFLGQARKWDGLVQSVFHGSRQYPGKYVTDLDRARTLLSEAGFPEGRGLSGAGLALTYTAEEQALLEPVATELQTTLAQVGVRVQLNPIPKIQFDDRELVKKDIPFFIQHEVVSNGFDAGFVIQQFFISNDQGALQNSTNYSRSEVDELYFAQKTQTGADREASLDRLQDILIDDLPRIPIAERPTIIAARDNIAGWAPNPQANPIEATFYWHLERS